MNHLDENRTARSTIAGGEPSTLDRITDRIDCATRAAREIGSKLHAHADRVSGPVPETKGAGTESERDRPYAAIERIWQALDELDAAQANTAEGAGRNCTLA